MKQMIVNCEALQTRIAVTENGRIEEYYVELNEAENIVGSIFKGRVRNLEDSLQAAFVDVGLSKNAFLHYWDMLPASTEALELDDDEGDGEADGDNDGTEARDAGDSPRPSGQRSRNREQEASTADGPRPNRRQRSRNRRPRPDRRQERGESRERGAESTGSAKAAPPAEPAEPAEPVGLMSKLKKIFFGGEAESAPSPKGGNGGKAERPPNNRDRDVADDRGGGRNRGNRRGSDDPGRRGGRGERGGRDERGSRDDRGGRARSRQEDDGRSSGDGGSRSNGRGRSGGRSGGREDRAARDKQLAEIPKQFPVNTEVVVQVTKGMIGTKGPRVTTNLSIPGRYVVLLPHSTHRGVSKRIEDRKERTRLRKILHEIELPSRVGVICRTAGAGLEEEALRLDIQLVLDKWIEAEKRIQSRKAPLCVYDEPRLLERAVRDLLSEEIDEIIVDSKDAYDLTISYLGKLQKKDRTTIRLYDNPKPIYEHFKLTQQIAQIYQRKVPLPSGAELAIDETEAMIAIDINSGKSRDGKDHPETILRTNLEAAAEVARQLRLRNIGGLVVVDFIDMRAQKDRVAVYRAFKDAVAPDRSKTKILPISKLGLLEMTRQREYASLRDSTFESCHYCNGKGLVKSSMTISVELQRRLQEILRRDKGHPHIRVTVNPQVLDRLRKEDAAIINSMEQEFGGNLTFRSDGELHQEEFRLTNTDTGREV